MRRQTKRILSVGLAASVMVGVVVPAADAAGSTDISLRGGAWLPGVDKRAHAEGGSGSNGEKAQGKLIFDMETVGEEPGTYAGGEADLGSVGIHAFYGAATVPNLRTTTTLTSIDGAGHEASGGTTSSDEPPMELETYHLLAGYELGPISVGGGWLSLTEVQTRQGLIAVWDNRTAASGPALGGFGTIPVSGALTASGHVLYAPNVDTATTVSGIDSDGEVYGYSKDAGNGKALSAAARLGYQVTESFSVGVGYHVVGMRTDASEETTTDPHTATEQTKTAHSSLLMSGYFAGATFSF